MAVHEVIHVAQFSPGNVPIAVAITIPIAIAVSVSVLMPLITLFLVHEAVRVTADLFADFRMTLHILPEVAVILHKFLVIHERGIFANLLGQLRVFVQEVIEIRQLAPSNVVEVLTNGHRSLCLREGWSSAPKQGSERARSSKQDWMNTVLCLIRLR